MDTTNNTQEEEQEDPGLLIYQSMIETHKHINYSFYTQNSTWNGVFFFIHENGKISRGMFYNKKGMPKESMIEYQTKVPLNKIYNVLVWEQDALLFFTLRFLENKWILEFTGVQDSHDFEDIRTAKHDLMIYYLQGLSLTLLINTNDVYPNNVTPFDL